MLLLCCHNNRLNNVTVVTRIRWRKGAVKYRFDKVQPCACFSVARGCVNSIRIWPPRRDERSGVLIGVGGTRRSDWLRWDVAFCVVQVGCGVLIGAGGTRRSDWRRWGEAF